tara:strand:+ start:167 stop:418 length:252 start_codon:yes stop_codon:yes gene_type:complete
MKCSLLSLLAALAFMTPVYSCPIEGQDKDQLLSELCNIGDDGKWESNRLNEMIILAKYEKLPPEGTKKGNSTLAALTCEFGYL